MNQSTTSTVYMRSNGNEVTTSRNEVITRILALAARDDAVFGTLRHAISTASACATSESLDGLPAVPADAVGHVPSNHEHETNLREFLAKDQPCLYGRMGAKGRKGIQFPICTISSADIDLGRQHVATKIQTHRDHFKSLAAEGLVSAFLVYFYDAELALIPPSPQLLSVQAQLCQLYLIEHPDILVDAIYTEAVPLADGSQVLVFKGGINIFYASAARTDNHDRRVPGGMVISTNSPGHLAHSWVRNRVHPDLESAVAETLRLAVHSIGNGGIDTPKMESCSWHNQNTGTGGEQHERLRLSPDINLRRYSARYHTDVLLPSDVTAEGISRAHFQALSFDYISSESVGPESLNYGFYHGVPMPRSCIFENPWPARLVTNIQGQ